MLVTVLMVDSAGGNKRHRLHRNLRCNFSFFAPPGVSQTTLIYKHDGSWVVNNGSMCLYVDINSELTKDMLIKAIYKHW